ncbi:uncharacterized protein LAESUDRAFT_731763 [Laetiporus sulphureus 93-53]|uniref:Uncharacterized protein n=1 Tax=Laetiporus sulphureus 93-53 TaxID=1314785 RepID=A0A165BF60_9APHY|nr:uncharacterized protein LAESUDRAFT_731763 [Laetiporus sulphureus 93-53]KZT00924.1 hypothetical protein LAESUDRAFT_731763 [Laetiporus sulphureus 93-53]
MLALSSYILPLTLFKDEFYEEEVTWGCSTLEQAAIIWGIPLAVVVTILFGQALGLVVMRRWLEEWSIILQDVSVKRALTSSATGLPLTIVASIAVYQFVDFFKS